MICIRETNQASVKDYQDTSEFFSDSRSRYSLDLKSFRHPQRCLNMLQCGR